MTAFLAKYSLYVSMIVGVALILCFGRGDIADRLFSSGLFLGLITLVYWPELRRGETRLLSLQDEHEP